MINDISVKQNFQCSCDFLIAEYAANNFEM